jgi:hypothetical protein
MAKLEAAMKERLAEFEAWRDKREEATKRGRKGGLNRQATRDEDDEPEWIARAIEIAQKARDTDPTISSTDIVRERIMARLKGADGLPGFDMLMKYMARWEAAGLVKRKTPMSASAPPRGKRKAKLQPL